VSAVGRETHHAMATVPEGAPCGRSGTGTARPSQGGKGRLREGECDVTDAPDAIGPIRARLEAGTLPDLAVAFQQLPGFCRSFYSLEMLLDLHRREGAILRATTAIDVLRAEIVRRLLITADRSEWRSRFLDFLRVDGCDTTSLHSFV